MHWFEMVIAGVRVSLPAFGLCCGLLSAPAAQAADIFVAVDGDDLSGDGSIAAPYATLARAASTVGPGDTIQVRGGTYSVTSEQVISAIGSDVAPIRIRPFGTETVLLDAASATLGSNQHVVRIINSQYIEFRGFEIANSSGRGIGVSVSTYITVADNRVHDIHYRAIGGSGDHLYIEGNEVWNCALSNDGGGSSSGWPGAIQTWTLSASEPSTNIFIRGNHVHDCWGEAIIPNFADTVLIEDNELHDNYSVHIYVDTARNVQVRRNHIYTTTDRYNRDLGISRPATGVGLASESYTNTPEIGVENVIIANNLMAGTGIGVSYWHDDTNVSPTNTYQSIGVFNNVFIDTTTYTVNFFTVDSGHTPPSGVEIQNNIIFAGNDGNTLQVGNPAAFSFSHNNWPDGIPPLAAEPNSFNDDPLFEAPDTTGPPTGYRLLGGSTSIQAGTPLTEVPTDFWGTARSAASPCVGIHEFGSPSGACCSPTGACSETTEVECDGLGGSYLGALTSCDPNPCPGPGTGACCDGFDCSILSQPECEGLNGVYRGDTVSCIPNPCGSCTLGLIEEIRALEAVKAASGADLLLSWRAEDHANGYNSHYVETKAAIPDANGSPPAANAVPGCADRPDRECLHVGAVPGAAGTHYFYNVLGVCDGTEAPW